MGLGNLKKEMTQVLRTYVADSVLPAAYKVAAENGYSDTYERFCEDVKEAMKEKEGK